jgi:hypothetical protein
MINCNCFVIVVKILVFKMGVGFISNYMVAMESNVNEFKKQMDRCFGYSISPN